MRLRLLSIGAALALASASPGLAQQPAAPAQGDPHAHAEKAQAAAASSKEAFDPKVARRITPDDVKKRMDAGDKVVFVDTRSSFTGPKVAGAHHVPLGKVGDWSKDLAKDTLIVAYCT